ncbi:MAG TPA: tyrosine--tRNA ligase [Euryarchaeota archaeon]|nr:tyrosine--tRNA ligase [archaeon BMS3Bbin16]HDH28665.1 tyrosine--tRNA ligase [Euryarchaeota archaeon]
MDSDEKLELIFSNTSEIIAGEEIEKAVKSGKPLKAYAGYEPSGRIHLGHALSVNKLIELQRAGVNVVVLLADLHAHLNSKGSLADIRKTAEYNKECFIALGLDREKTEFVLGSEIQLDPDYFLNVQRLALTTTLLRARRSMDVVGRVEENPSVARVIYPLMQVMDMVALGVDIAVGGSDQRKIHMLARDNLPRLGLKSPAFLHLPIIHGLDGDEKMSSSKGNLLSVDDPADVIKKKIKNAYCPMNVVEGNPVLELYKYHVFPRTDVVVIKRPEKYGGDLSYNNYINLEEDFLSGAVHPQDLKNTLGRELIRLLEPVRKYFET